MEYFCSIFFKMLGKIHCYFLFLTTKKILDKKFDFWEKSLIFDNNFKFSQKFEFLKNKIRFLTNSIFFDKKSSSFDKTISDFSQNFGKF